MGERLQRSRLLRRQRPLRRWPLLAALLFAACSVQPPIDTAVYLERRVADRLTPEQAARFEVPFRLSDELEGFVTGRVDRAASQRKQVDQVLDLIFSGVGLEYSLYPTRNAVETFAARQANCLSFVHLFVGFARTQKLNPFYVEVEDYKRWSYESGAVISRGHIVAGMYVDGDLKTYDFLPYRPKSYRDFEPIDDLTAIAHHYNNLGAEALLRRDLDEARANLEIAVALDPTFDKALNNLGVVHLRRGELEAARDLYERTLELHPEYPPVLTNLARTYQELGSSERAEELMARLDELDQVSPFFSVYKAQRALADGDARGALGHMRDALRIESEIPEIHVGLVKVYLALGETAKARHHLERALKLDATHEEARQYALLLAGRAAAPGAGGETDPGG